ncbi:putative N-acetylglucosamine-6-phosphate deacetylase [Lobulomyces angularis]|nr:putative N-acetylglucosamine-6-phosphate deacetylase [Lobulomyces angularis]
MTTSSILNTNDKVDNSNNDVKILKLINCRLIIKEELLSDQVLFIDVTNGKILDGQKIFFQERNWSRLNTMQILDCNNLIVSPGYIDIQINGGFGVDFTADVDIVEGLKIVSKELLKRGCTSFCPTIVSSDSKIYENILPKIRQRKGSVKDGAEILGVHCEGPFIAPEKKGAHQEKVLKSATNGIKDFQEVYGMKNLNNIKIITLAPEVEGVNDTISELVKRNIVVSIGHTSSSVKDSERAIENGATLVTHLFNAMQAFHHRDPGPVGLLGSFNIKKPYYGLICDGIHSHPNSVKIAYSSHPKGAIIVTDAMAAAGLSDGIYKLGEMEAKVSEDYVFINGTETLAGSKITMDDSVKNFRKFTGCSIVEAINSATINPAKALGVQNKKGILSEGNDADIIFLDDDLNVKKVFVAGIEFPLNK